MVVFKTSHCCDSFLPSSQHDLDLDLENSPLTLIPVLWFHFLGNGFIEAGELDEFLKSLWKEGHPGKVKRLNFHNVLL